MATGKRQEPGITVVQDTEQRFSREQIAASERYRDQRDLVNALLENGKSYTIATVDDLIEGYRKGKVR